MKKMSLWLTGLVILSAGVLHGQPSASTSSEHLVSVEPDVNLQVLDWGGTGRPLIFLSGLGDRRENSSPTVADATRITS